MKPIRVFDILFRRRLIYVSVFGILILLLAVVFVILMFGSARKTKAHTMYDGEIVKQGETTYDNTNLVIPANSTVEIDGEHTYSSVTVKSGATLTSNDYNKYGVYNSYDRSYDAAELFKSNDGYRYAYILRGYLNTGNDHTRTYSGTNGAWAGVGSKNKPFDFNVDDVITLEFYTPLASSAGGVYNASDFELAKRQASAYARYGVAPTTYQDAISSAASPIIPFEIRYFNAGDYHSFGVASCPTAADCANSANYTFFTNLPLTTNFNLSAAEPEIHTHAAWQGAGTSLMTGLASVYTVYANYRDFLDNYRSGTTYSAASFYNALNYDYSTDKKIIAAKNAQILTTPTYLENSGQYENVSTSGTIYRQYSSFYPTNSYASPFALRLDQDGGAISGYPILSQALASTMTKKTATIINVPSGTFHLESGAKINFNGKGFARGYNNATDGSGGGTGPGGGGYDSNHSWGADHAGTGGYSSASGYDSSALVDPLLPGSGSRMRDAEAWDTAYNGYGGGMIKIAAKIINLDSNSRITAIGVGGNGGFNPGASGGAIILSDKDSHSTYFGLIAANGGISRRSGGAGGHGSSDQGGGGGGYISILTGAETGALLAKYQTDLSKRPCNSDLACVDAGQFFSGPDISIWQAWGFAANTITASGGWNETNNPATYGNYGIVKIASSAPTSVSIKKSLKKICDADYPNCAPIPSGLSPYGLKPGDIIEVTLEVNNLTLGQPITIKDEYFNDGSGAVGSYFQLVAKSFSNQFGWVVSDSGIDISFTFTPTSAQQILKYKLLVK